MQLLFKVKPIEVKRAFSIAQKMRSLRRRGTRYLPKLEREEFLKKLKQGKKTIMKFSEKQLDKFIGEEYEKRLVSYNNVEWYRGAVSTREVGVWRRAGGLPASWTCCSLVKTAHYVRQGLEKNDKRIRARSKRAISSIIEHTNIISKEKYLFPIAFYSGGGTRGRKRCRKYKEIEWDVDDGCMRAIALAITGYKFINVYFGKPK